MFVEWVLVVAGFALWIVALVASGLGLTVVFSTPWAGWAWAPGRVLSFVFFCLLAWVAFLSFGAAFAVAQKLLAG